MKKYLFVLFAWLICFNQAAAFTTPSANAQALLINGDFENTNITTLGNGYRQYEGWTEISSAGFIWLEGTNGPSSFDIRSTRFDGASSTAPDPYFPYQSATDQQLDHIAALRPGTESLGSLISDPFLTGNSVGFDVWRESTGAVSIVKVARASDNEVLASLTLTSPEQQWTRFSLDTSSFYGTEARVVLHGGTTNSLFGWLTMYDNVAVSPVPVPASYVMMISGLGLLTFAVRRQHRDRSPQ